MDVRRPPAGSLPRGAEFVTDDRPAGGRTLVVSGEIDLATAQAFEQFLHQHLHAADRPGVLDLDLSRVLFFSAIGLRILLKATDVAGVQGARLRVVALSQSVAHVLDVTDTRGRLDLHTAPRAGDPTG